MATRYMGREVTPPQTTSTTMHSIKMTSGDDPLEGIHHGGCGAGRWCGEMVRGDGRLVIGWLRAVSPPAGCRAGFIALGTARGFYASRPAAGEVSRLADIGPFLWAQSDTHPLCL